jgi:exonuclease SbcC
MKIKSIEFKNFASYGNSIQKIEFEDNKAELLLTLGKNGEGKTTIANAIVYALYGKVEGVKMADLPNRINKELWVRIELYCKGTKVEIERGLMPNRFKVLLNDVEFDKAGKKSVQDYLEEEIFGIPYHVFKNIIILSVNDFKSFLTMTNHDKRQIIDKMFGFSILNDMQKQIKEERRDLKIELDSYEKELNQLSENIVSVNMKLNQLLAEADTKNKEEIEALKESLKRYDANRIKLEEASSKVSKKISSNQENLQEKQSNYSKLKYELDELKKKLALYESDKCPTCEGELTSSFHQERKKEIENKTNTLPSEIEKAEKSVTAIKDDIADLRIKDRAINDKVSTINTNIRNLKGELIKIKDSLGSNKDFSHLGQIIEDFETQEKEKSNKKDETSRNYNFLEILEEVLGEDGVKNLAVKTILPGLNANIAAMGQTMHLPFHIRFDEKFNCLINHLGEEINPLTLSTGERKKADFIIIIAIIKILKLRFPQLTSVDADGVHNILKILSQVIKDSKINTFVINHTVLPHELFDKKIQIYRENGFSKLDIEVIE